jgi:hypothetical protein
MLLYSCSVAKSPEKKNVTIAPSTLDKEEISRITKSLEIYASLLGKNEESVSIFTLINYQGENLVLQMKNTFKDKLDSNLKDFSNKDKTPTQLLEKEFNNLDQFKSFVMAYIDRDRIIVYQVNDEKIQASLFQIM